MFLFSSICYFILHVFFLNMTWSVFRFLRIYTKNIWKNQLPPDFTNWHGNISTINPLTPGFTILTAKENPLLSFPGFDLSRRFSQLVHSNFDWTTSPRCMPHTLPSICDISHLLIDYPKSSHKRVNQKLYLSDITLNIRHIFCSQYYLKHVFSRSFMFLFFSFKLI